MIPATGSELVVLGLRVLFVLALYGLLVWVALSARRGIGDAYTPDLPRARASRLLVLASPGGVPAPATVFELAEVTTIGRVSGNQIVLPDSGVSAQHARLQWEKSHWRITDLGSTNGTLINDKLIHSATPLEPGDLIGIGPIVLRLL